MYKKILRAVFLPLLVLGAACVFGSTDAQAVMQISILEVTGELRKLDESVNPPKITLTVEGKEASGTLVPDCQFMDDQGRALPRREFLRRYTGKYVTLELYEDTGGIISCKASKARR
jgi:hypothetical protein